MVTIRLTTFIIGLSMILLGVRNCTALSLKAVEIIVAVDGNGVISKKEMFDGIPTEAAVEKKMLRGRKLKMIQKDLKKTGGLKILGATYPIAKGDHEGKEKLNVKSKLAQKRSHPLTNLERVDMFAFSADYRTAKPHPPKNN